MNERFNVGVAAALVLGGVAALLLATALAIGGYGRSKGTPARSTAAVGSSAQPAASGLPDSDVEYLLETDEPSVEPRR